MGIIKVPQIYQDHCVLQRDKVIRFQGEVSEPVSIRIVLGDVVQEYQVNAGRFLLEFPAQPAGRHKTLSFYCNGSDVPELSFEDVSIGDVWLAAGQSNMEFFMRYDAHWNETKQLPVNPDIHMFNCPQIAFDGQKRSLPYSGYWFEQGNAAWNEFSAPGFYFAHFLQPDLDVPVGIIGCNWGGTPACAWMGESYLKKEPLSIFQKEYDAEVAKYSPDELARLSMESWNYEDSYRHQLEWRAMMYGMTSAEQKTWQKEHEGDPALPMGPFHHYRPSGLYHTMLETIAPFSMKGVLWYQGESDSGHPDIYDQTLSTMIQCFRDTFKDDQLPFLIVQLAPFGKWLDCTNDGYAEVRQKQEIVAKTVPNVYLTSIMDLGMWEDIHPKEKREVGRRLALLAKGNLYGYPILANPPAFSHAEISADEITIYCKDTGDSLSGTGDLTTNFKVSVHSKNYDIKNVTLDGHLIHIQLRESLPASFTTVSISTKDNKLTISYANENYCIGNIWNAAGLPLNPFVHTI